MSNICLCKQITEEEIVKAVKDGAKTFEELKDNWNKLTQEKSEEIVDIVMNEILDKVIVTLDRDEAKVKYLIKRMTKTIKRSVETVRVCLKSGGYVAAEHEKSFCIDGDNIHGFGYRIGLMWRERMRKD